MNLHAYGAHDNVLLVFVHPPLADTIESMDDAAIVAMVCDALKAMFRRRTLPKIVEHVITRWRADTFVGEHVRPMPLAHALSQNKRI
jgi:hypothetical protein